MTRQHNAASVHTGRVAIVFAAIGMFLTAYTLNLAYAADPPMPYQQARETRAAITRGDYATARRIVETVLAESHFGRWNLTPFEGFMAAASEVSDPVFAAHLKEWVARDPTDAVALLMSAQYNLHRAFSARGDNWSTKTEKSRLVTFADYSADALDAVERSIQSDNRNPFSLYLKLAILHGFGLHKDMLPQFKAAVAKFPTYYPLYSIFLDTLEPRWGGSIDAMYAYVDQYAGHAPKDSPLKLLYVALYRNLLGYASFACSSSSLKGDADLMPRCVEVALQRFVRPELEENLKVAFALAGTGDQYEFNVAVEPLLYAIAATPDGQIPAAKVIQMAADALHSGIGLERGNPGRNSYVIDTVMSRYWLQQHVLDKALNMAKAALLDVEKAHFPSATDKNIALAGIHELMALIYSDQGHRAEMVGAEKAALDLGVPTVHAQFVCLGYYGLKDYPRAIEACSQIVADDPDNMEARFWRGQAYVFSKRHSEAEADLTVVAESSSRRRFDAAISIVMMDFADKDYRAAVATIDKYPYLFDPRLSDEKTVAMTYYNRCYAEWQLGELKPALDDCDQSIRLSDTSGAQYMLSEIKRQMTAH